MAADDQGWLFEDSPALVLVLDESLVCQNMATVWRERLAKDVAESTSISAAELFDFDSEIIGTRSTSPGSCSDRWYGYWASSGSCALRSVHFCWAC